MKQDIKDIKKRVTIMGVIVLFLLLFYLLYPNYLGEMSDGGSKVWEAKLYTVVYWNKLEIYDEEKDMWVSSQQNGWKIYIWPKNHEWEHM